MPELSETRLGKSWDRCIPTSFWPNTTYAGLAGTHQITNARLAAILSQKFLELKELAAPQKTLPTTFIEGLKAARWPGRCQTVNDPTFFSIVWFLDGAHTVESLECCIEWFVSPTAALRTVSAG